VRTASKIFGEGCGPVSWKGDSLWWLHQDPAGCCSFLETAIAGQLGKTVNFLNAGNQYWNSSLLIACPWDKGWYLKIIQHDITGFGHSISL
jgi:hypothetical protein